MVGDLNQQQIDDHLSLGRISGRDVCEGCGHSVWSLTCALKVEVAEANETYLAETSEKSSQKSSEKSIPPPPPEIFSEINSAPELSETFEIFGGLGGTSGTNSCGSESTS